MNPMLLIDGYKLDHRRQYPSGTQRIQSNWTARSSRDPRQKFVVFFGLQYFLKKYLIEDMQKYFFDRPLDDVLNEHRTLQDEYIGPNDMGVDHIADLWKLKYLPLQFNALPEGTKVPIGIPMLTVENTIDDFYWLVNSFETLMSNTIWLPCTSATTAYRYRALLDWWANMSDAPLDGVQWQGHDFSFRGMAGVESAMLSGAGHLLSFAGSDTIPAIQFIRKYYGYGMKTALIAGSVPATEHSVMCAGGQTDERETFNRLLGIYPNGILSVVSDTWDLWKVIQEILPSLKEKILARDGKLVIRPDSGDPVKIICGDEEAPLGSPERKGVIELLWDIFGGTTTATGHKVLDSHIGAIYGDSITLERASQICTLLYNKGFASTNVVLGIGSYTYQYVTRDTFGHAMKATWARVNDVDHDLFKKPVTDSGLKFSATGRLAVLKNEAEELYLVQKATSYAEQRSLLRSVYLDGTLVADQGFNAIRHRLHPTWKI